MQGIVPSIAVRQTVIDKIPNELHAYQNVCKCLNAFIHLTSAETGELLWHNTPSFLEKKDVEGLCFDDFRRLALELASASIKSYPQKKSISYQLYQNRFYETITPIKSICDIDGYWLLGVTIKVEKPVNLPKILANVRKSNESLQNRLCLANVSPKEKEVLRLVLRHKSTKEIAKLLGKSINTVKNQKRRLLKRLGCSRASDLPNLITESDLLEIKQ